MKEMDVKILEEIIQDFSIDKFVDFFRGKTRKFVYLGEELEEDDSENFKEGQKLGEIKFSRAEKLVVCSFKVNKELSERSGKKAQYEKGKKILKGEDADAGIFIFYDRYGNFRFSLIYPEYTGKRRKWSNFKRFTYLVSPNITNKTFLHRIGGGSFSSLENIKEAFSVEKVTKEFYSKIANWFFWAVQESKFPPDAEKEKSGKEMAVLRLITRLIFIWFMKVRQLVPEELFKKEKVKEILKDLSANTSTYYKAILQNLFFATLNTKQDERQFRREVRGRKGYNPDYGNPNVYRYHELFKNPEKMREYFADIPFLNGGLFECLDYKSKSRDERIFIDGFTDIKQFQPHVPNFLFFSDEVNVDLNKEYGTKNKKYKIYGLINILSEYNFTVDENEPDDILVALAPELLGIIFENLLASYNPETATTARKATGSYYTPREIVNYMVEQSLIYYFKTHLLDVPDIENKLEELFSREKEHNPFDRITTKKLISLIENLRIVDPAVGSGAFPMGILNKLVFILSKLDPENVLWKQAQIEAINRDVKDPVLKEKLLKQTEIHFKNKDVNYIRKLYLIEKCIYGVDIQQIAVEIAKLRFFISLLVDEKINPNKPNFGIEPLPNLDFKLMQGNSLIENLSVTSIVKNKKLAQTLQNGLLNDPTWQKLTSKFEKEKDNFFLFAPHYNKREELEKLKSLERKIFEYEREWIIKFFTNREKQMDFILGESFSKYDALIKDLENLKFPRPDEHFEWHIEFSEVFKEKGGFDIVIANPPYGNILKKWEKKNINKNYSFSTTSDISSPFIEKGVNLLKNSGNLVYIITYAITFNKDFSRSRQLLNDTFEKTEIYTFDRDRCRIFESMTQSVSIMKCFNKNSKDKRGIYTSRMFRNTPVIEQIEVSNCNNLLFPKNATYYQPHRLPKLGEKINVQILQKLLRNKNFVENIIKKDGKKIWIRTSGNYWYNAFDRKPYSSAEIKPMFIAKEYSDFLILLMNSSLFYFWFRIYGDGRHMNMDILKGFPLPVDNLISQYKILLSKMKERFMEKLFSVFDKTHNRFITSEIKSEIDLLDLVLGKYFYNLNYDEIIHILDYDSEVRTGNKLPPPFNDLINKIIALSKGKKNSTSQTKAKEYEHQIDQLVYKLYNLTEEEIKTIGDNCRR